MESSPSYGSSSQRPTFPSNDPDFIEQEICNENDLQENQMKTFPIGDDDKVLLVKQNGVYHAIGHRCPHYGAPLEKGALDNGRIRCPWHGACFNIKTGDIEDFPGMDSLPCYEVSVKDGKVFVKAARKQLKAGKRIKNFAVRKNEEESTLVVVGGGPAGANCVETLRQLGFTGRLVFIMGENYLPYDRIKLSKGLNIEIDKITLRNEEFYAARNIELIRGTRVTGIAPGEKKLTLSNGSTLHYDKVFLATGTRPRSIKVPGSDLDNVCVLRDIDNAQKIRKLATTESNVVILGASFIGLEVASILVGKVKSVSVIAAAAIPFENILGAEVGQLIQSLFEEKCVKFYMQQGIAQYKGDSVVKSVVLTNGTELPADLCIVGVGVVPNTEFLSNTGLQLLPDGTVKVDEHMSTNMDGIYAGGDMATAQVLGMEASIGHWGLANYHGHIAAKNMMGIETKLRAVPFFWTMLFGKVTFRYCGYAPKFEKVEIRGKLNSYSFVAFYVLDSGKVGAILTICRDPIAAQFGEMLNDGKQLMANDIDSWLGKF